MDEGIRVLHVDDDAAFAELVAGFLEREDDRFVVETETSAGEGLDFVATNEVDCIVSDYDMPGRNGIEFLETVRNMEPELPFVLFTGKGSEEVASEAVSAGVSDYLQKESGTEQYELLANRITNLVAKRETETDLRTRLRQQEIVCDLSQDALATGDVQSLFDRTTTSVASALDAEYAKVLEYRPDHDDLLLRAGDGWQDGLVGDAIVSADENSQAGYTLCSREPVVVPDISTEDRFVAPPLLIDHGVVSGISVLIGESDDPWGVFGVHATEHRQFTPDDINFVQSVANVLATAIERTDSERELARSKARFEALFEQSPDILLVHDVDGTIEEINETACTKLGYEREELLGKTIWEIDPEADPDRSRRFWEETAVGESSMFESTHVRKDGSAFPVEIHLIRIERQGDRFLAITRDVSQRKQRERTLERQTERLETFMDALAHDVPNHLNAANGYLELAREAGRAQHFDRVETAHERIETLVDDIQTLLRAGSHVDDREWIRLSSIAEPCWGSCCSDDSPATLEIADDGLIRGDENRLKQLFENLYWNACEHAGDDATVRVGLIDDGFYVADDGPGIPDEARVDVLQPGFTTTGDDHAGFGLAIVREIVDAHDWEIAVVESVDGGVRLEITGVDVATC